MNKKRSILLKIFFVLSTMLFIGLYSIDLSQDGTLDKIKCGRISYTNELGWVNWGHAIPTNAINGMVELKKLKEIDSTLHLFMQVKSRFFGVDLMGECKRSIQLNTVKDTTQLKRHFYSLFRKASSDLESYQGDLPFSLFSVSRESSFREGDLMGNLVSVYLAGTGIKIADFRKTLTDYSAKKSSLKFSEFGIQKHTWERVEKIVNGSSVSEPFSNFIKSFFKKTKKQINSSASQKIYFN